MENGGCTQKPFTQTFTYLSHVCVSCVCMCVRRECVKMYDKGEYVRMRIRGGGMWRRRMLSRF